LAELAERDGRSISELVREIVRLYIQEKDQEAQLGNELQVLETITEIRAQIQEKHSILDVAFLDEARKERERERGWS
jgi:metal-responsive CopG/Arc/MetJ family transcriptional regulator